MMGMLHPTSMLCLQEGIAEMPMPSRPAVLRAAGILGLGVCGAILVFFSGVAPHHARVPADNPGVCASASQPAESARLIGRTKPASSSAKRVATSEATRGEIEASQLLARVRQVLDERGDLGFLSGQSDSSSACSVRHLLVDTVRRSESKMVSKRTALKGLMALDAHAPPVATTDALTQLLADRGPGAESLQLLVVSLAEEFQFPIPLLAGELRRLAYETESDSLRFRVVELLWMSHLLPDDELGSCVVSCLRSDDDAAVEWALRSNCIRDVIHPGLVDSLARLLADTGPPSSGLSVVDVQVPLYCLAHVAASRLGIGQRRQLSALLDSDAYARPDSSGFTDLCLVGWRDVPIESLTQILAEWDGRALAALHVLLSADTAEFGPPLLQLAILRAATRPRWHAGLEPWLRRLHSDQLGQVVRIASAQGDGGAIRNSLSAWWGCPLADTTVGEALGDD